MNNTNPIFEALNNVNENYAAETILPRKRKMKKPLKIALIAVAATLALGTTAIAASSGERPIMKLNYKQMVSDYDEYVTADGWTVKTLTALEPYDDCIPYRPVGRIRALYENGSFIFYDELGVNILTIAKDTNIYGTAFKDGESDMMGRGSETPEYMRSGARYAADYSSVSYEEWIDPVEYVKYRANMAAYNRMSLEEKVYYLNLYGYSDFDDYGGIRHPSAEEVRSLDGFTGFYQREYETGYFPPDDDGSHKPYKSYNSYLFQSSPGEVYKLFGFTPIIGTEMTEGKERCYAMLNYDEDAKEFTQGLYQYSLTDTVSGTPIEFTVWHKAELRETFTEHFGFEYEYIELNNGTQARLHRSITGDYIAEFEHDGAAYAFKTSLDRENAIRILNDLV